MSRILFIGKRHPQQRDLITRPYGRFFYLPTELAKRGHRVSVLLCSHSGLSPVSTFQDNVHWVSHDLISLGPTTCLRNLLQSAREFQPDWVIGVSDAWYGWLAHYVARKVNARLAIDAYDNFESYMPWNKPLHWKWRKAVSAAQLVTAAGPHLASLLDRNRPHGQPTIVVPMTADPIFKKYDKYQARDLLKLPAATPLLGYAGGWAKRRGSDALLCAFRHIRRLEPGTHLVVTGNPPAHVRSEPGVLTTGYLPDDQLPQVISAIDVACVMTANTSFGAYSHPAKLCEAMACQTPLVATSTPPVHWMLEGDRRFLVKPGNANTLAQRILQQLKQQIPPPQNSHTWSHCAAILDSALSS